MFPRICTLLLGAGISGAMALLAPVASAIDGLSLEAEEPAAHEGDGVNAVGFAVGGPEGYWVISGGEDATLRSWIPQPTEQLLEQRVQFLDHEIYDLEASIDGSIVATGEGGWNGGTSTNTLRIWPALGFDIDSTAGHDGIGAPIGFVYVVAISPSPDNSYTAVSGFYGQILVYDTSSLTLYATAETGNKRTKALAYSPDGRRLAAIWKGGAIQLWSFPEPCDPTPCELVLVPVSMSHGGTWDLSLAYWPGSDSDMTKIASGTDSGMIKIWTILGLDEENPTVTVQSVPSGGVRSLDWSPDGSMIVAGGTDDITVYDANATPPEILFQEVDAHSGRVNDVAFFSATDGLKIASGGNDGALKLWQVPGQSPGCSNHTDCDDFNECTQNLCVGSVCDHPPVLVTEITTTCDGGNGICCSGSCRTATCSEDFHCNDSDSCTGPDECSNGGTCDAACNNSVPICGCIPTHSKEKGPRCRDGIDNDCDTFVDVFDPDC